MSISFLSAAIPCGLTIGAVLFACWLGNRKWIIFDVIAWILGGLLVFVVIGPILAYVFLLK